MNTYGCFFNMSGTGTASVAANKLLELPALAVVAVVPIVKLELPVPAPISALKLSGVIVLIVLSAFILRYVLAPGFANVIMFRPTVVESEMSDVVGVQLPALAVVDVVPNVKLEVPAPMAVLKLAAFSASTVPKMFTLKNDVADGVAICIKFCPTVVVPDMSETLGNQFPAFAVEDVVPIVKFEVPAPISDLKFAAFLVVIVLSALILINVTAPGFANLIKFCPTVVESDMLDAAG